jgi:hypothetical protein
MKQLLELIYMGMRLGGVISLLLTGALSIFAIPLYLCVRSFDVHLLLLLPPSALVLQGGALLTAGCISAAAV